MEKENGKGERREKEEEENGNKGRVGIFVI